MSRPRMNTSRSSTIAVTPNMCYVVQLSVDGASKPHNEFGKYIIHAVWGSAGRWGRTAKLVVVVGPDGRALLGRQAAWPPAWFSTLAGFVEPGESAEAAVVREIGEEAARERAHRHSGSVLR
mgnify:CR=1 FL=1